MTAPAVVERSIAGDVTGLWEPQFPSPELVGAAAGLLPSVMVTAGENAVEWEGPRWEIVVAPGAVQVRTRDWSRQSRYQERQRERHAKDVDALAAWYASEGSWPADAEPVREITGWSRKSRANMVKTLCQLDYGPMLGDRARIPAMVTLTYPGDWEVVAPNGGTVKRHLKSLRKRYRRAWGEHLVCIWKLEFQRRGAPHFHLLMVPPHGVGGGGRAFRAWLSETWAAVVAHPDPEQRRRHVLAGTGVDYAEGLRATDPKRVAVYFTKHGSFAAKEYQHCVPELWRAPGQGPGRFWGYWGLRPSRAGVVTLPALGIWAGRIMRRWARAQGPHWRKRRLLRNNRGWVSVNSGPAFTSQLSRALTCVTGAEP